MTNQSNQPSQSPRSARSTRSPLDTQAAISQAIYQAILETSQQHPEFITSKYRTTPWSLVQATFLSKIHQRLNNFSTPQALAKRIEEILHIFLEPAFFYSPQAADLQSKIKHLISSTITRAIVNNSPLDSQNGFNGKGGISILLLDAENLQLDAATERFLAQICHYPLQIKIAFANWRHMGKQDLEFHQRGYELIHVPAGKDSADVKLATVGSSIFVHYPTAKEVLVCSSDMVLTHLCTTLQTHGLRVYLVRKKGEILTASDLKTGKTYTRMLKISADINSLTQLITQLQKIIYAEQQLTSKPWIKLSRLSQLFRSRYHLTISQVVSIYLPGQKARELFLGHPEIFVVHKPTKEAGIYITLFDRSPLPQNAISGRIIAIPHGVEIPKGTNGVKSSNGLASNLAPNIVFSSTDDMNQFGSNTGGSLSAITFSSQENLEVVLINLIREVTQANQTKSIFIGVLGNQFSRRYGRKITDVVKALKLASTFSLFLESSPLFNLDKTDGQAKVSLV